MNIQHVAAPMQVGGPHANHTETRERARTRFVTVAQCAQMRPYTEPALRDMRFKAFDRINSRGETIEGNGTGPAGVWVKIGGKLLIDLDALDAWTEDHKLVALNDTIATDVAKG